MYLYFVLDTKQKNKSYVAYPNVSVLNTKVLRAHIYVKFSLIPVWV